jgi:hypothetical protein
MKVQLTGLACAAALAGLVALPVTAPAQQRTLKSCNDEWTANRAAIQASGKLKKDFIAECRSGTTAAAKPAQPAPATTGARAPEEQSPASRTAAPARAPATVGLGNAQFASESAAKARCPGDTVVWANLNSKIYHYSSAKSYGHTKRGAFMCERDTEQAGIHAARNEKRPER